MNQIIDGLMIIHRVRPWPSTKPTMAQLMVFAGRIDLRLFYFHNLAIAPEICQLLKLPFEMIVL